MRIVTNPGANLTEKQVARYNIHMLPLLIKVDGVNHDIRVAPSLDEVDRWVATAREHPHILGTSAADFIEVFRSIAPKDPEILALLGSRKIVGSYKSAASAARTLITLPGFEHVRVEVVDTAATDVSLGYCAMLAGESMRAGRTFGQTVEVVERFAEQGAFAFVPSNLERLVRGGRASFVRAWLADFLKVSPIIGFKDGELAALGKVARDGDVAGALVDAMVKKVGAGRAVWVAVCHARAPEEAARVATLLKERLAVVHFEERLFCATSYLQAGRVVGAAVHPVDRLPWTPPIPPRT